MSDPQHQEQQLRDRVPLTCDRFVRGGNVCGRKAIGASYDINDQYGIGYCEKHEPLGEAMNHLRREHPGLHLFLSGEWMLPAGRAMAAPYVAAWRWIRGR
jgi:hypothetical protein